MSGKELIRKVAVTAKIDPDLLNRVRGMCWITPGQTLSRFVEDCLRDGLETLERQQGKPFDPAPAQLRNGRPLRMGDE
jgi:hypothetical protein